MGPVQVIVVRHTFIMGRKYMYNIVTLNQKHKRIGITPNDGHYHANMTCHKPRRQDGAPDTHPLITVNVVGMS